MSWVSRGVARRDRHRKGPRQAYLRRLQRPMRDNLTDLVGYADIHTSMTGIRRLSRTGLAIRISAYRSDNACMTWPPT
jgi:hypothetical protein